MQARDYDRNPALLGPLLMSCIGRLRSYARFNGGAVHRPEADGLVASSGIHGRESKNLECSLIGGVEPKSLSPRRHSPH